MFRKARNLARNRRGQSTIEYILILFIVVSVAMKFKGIYLKSIDPLVQKVFEGVKTVGEPDS